MLTNGQTFDQQTKTLAKCNGFRGSGSSSSEGHFVRLSHNLSYMTEPTDGIEAMAKMRTLMMNVCTPIDAPSDVPTYLGPTWWTSYCDIKNLVYYFDWNTNPCMLWIEFDKLDFSTGRSILYINPKDPIIMGEVSSLFHRADKKERMIDSLSSVNQHWQSKNKSTSPSE